MTQAKMGRSMKNCGMGLVYRWAGAASLATEGCVGGVSATTVTGAPGRAF